MNKNNFIKSIKFVYYCKFPLNVADEFKYVFISTSFIHTRSFFSISIMIQIFFIEKVNYFCNYIKFLLISLQNNYEYLCDVRLKNYIHFAMYYLRLASTVQEFNFLLFVSICFDFRFSCPEICWTDSSETWNMVEV